MRRRFLRDGSAPANQSDLLLSHGLYGVRRTLPAVPGREAPAK